jgi:N-acetylmuramoyl-L-alanine amidase
VPTDLPIIVLDPGHGGSAAAGGSSANNATGPTGLLEKDATLDLARRVERHLGGRARVMLTRTGDVNLSLVQRAQVAADHDARAFVSLHFNGDASPATNGAEVFVARGAGDASRRLARAVLDGVLSADGLPDRGVKDRDLGVIAADRHDPGTAACLLEVSFLTNPDEERRLRDEGYKERLAQGIAEAIARQLGGGEAAVAQSLAAGEGSPLRDLAVERCWQSLEALRRSALVAGNPNVVSAQRINAETGLTPDSNPYHNITREELEAVVRAAYTSHQPPELLLALWAKEGSTESVLEARTVPGATNAANARTLFRSFVYFDDLGSDFFLDTTRPGGDGDNEWDTSDAAAPAHEARFAAAVAGLVAEGLLDTDLTAAVNAELPVAMHHDGSFNVTPTVKFYALTLVLMDALFTHMQRTSFPQLTSLSPGMTYLQWNMGPTKFRKEFLVAADAHRRERAFLKDGQPMPLEQWALQTHPRSTEWRQVRFNAAQFKHYMESYEPIFDPARDIIRPGHLDTPLPVPEDARALAAAALPDLGPWARLVSFRPPETVQRSLAKHVPEWTVHRLEAANGPINLDHYPVEVRTLPEVDGLRLTAEQLLAHVRTHLDDFVDTRMCSFQPYDEDEASKWASADPVDAVVHIDMRSGADWANPDDGSVVCAEAAPDHWIFSTIWTLGDGGHPVSGNRWFGFSEESGTLTFSTRGADRPTTLADAALADVIFTSAHALWMSLQQGIARFVNEHGGDASVGVAHSERYDWPAVSLLHWSPTASWL